MKSFFRHRRTSSSSSPPVSMLAVPDRRTAGPVGAVRPAGADERALTGPLFPVPSGTSPEQDGLPASAAGAGDEPEAGPSTRPLARANGDATGPTPIPTGLQGERSEAVHDSTDDAEWLRRESLSLESHQAAGSFPGSPLTGTRAIGAESAIDYDADDEGQLFVRPSRSALSIVCQALRTTISHAWAMALA